MVAEAGCVFRNEVCENAALVGSLDILKVAVRLGQEVDEYTGYAAAAGGHLNVMRWLKKQNCVMARSLYAIAAKHGHLELLKCMWLDRPKLDASVCDRAAMTGHLNIVQWARQNDCP